MDLISYHMTKLIRIPFMDMETRILIQPIKKTWIESETKERERFFKFIKILSNLHSTCRSEINSLEFQEQIRFMLTQKARGERRIASDTA